MANLNDLVGEYLISPEYQRLRALHPRVEVETQLEPELLNIMGSPVHLSKTLMNLVSNAAEAMTSGGKIIIATENRHLDNSLKGKEVREGDYAVLRVSDTGVGISTDDLHRIFEPFFTKKNGPQRNRLRHGGGVGNGAGPSRVHRCPERRRPRHRGHRLPAGHTRGIAEAPAGEFPGFFQGSG